jgi:hypothetical protein
VLAILPCRFDLLHGATFGILFCVFRIWEFLGFLKSPYCTLFMTESVIL